MEAFSCSRLPRLVFGAGAYDKLPAILAGYGSPVLVVTGGESLASSGRKLALEDALDDRSLDYFTLSVNGEPSPELVDLAVERYRGAGVAVVCSVGGGSVIDAGKAISAMLQHVDSVRCYLEGVGDGRRHDGRKVPFVAVPTTAGTGSEATKNAVLSSVGPAGFKKSLRHENFVPEVAVVDPELTLHAPFEVTAAAGMDCLTQLLESYISTSASPFTDSLAETALELALENLIPACTSSADDIRVRSALSYASYISGVTLASAGLGVVHGFASSVGGRIAIPHGALCGTLLAPAIRMTVDILEREPERWEPALKKLARTGALLGGTDARTDDGARRHLLVDTLYTWMEITRMPRLRDYGLRGEDIPDIAAMTSAKNNPGDVGRDELAGLLRERF